jgi:hypothetical protein
MAPPQRMGPMPPSPAVVTPPAAGRSRLPEGERRQRGDERMGPHDDRGNPREREIQR